MSLLDPSPAPSSTHGHPSAPRLPCSLLGARSVCPQPRGDRGRFWKMLPPRGSMEKRLPGKGRDAPEKPSRTQSRQCHPLCPPHPGVSGVPARLWMLLHPLAHPSGQARAVPSAEEKLEEPVVSPNPALPVLPVLPVLPALPALPALPVLPVLLAHESWQISWNKGAQISQEKWVWLQWKRSTRSSTRVCREHGRAALWKTGILP